MKRKTRIITLVIVNTIVGLTIVHIYGAHSDSVTSAQAAGSNLTQNACKEVSNKAIVVSIQQRHLWACQDIKSVYDSSVVTGYMKNAANITPIGTYKIYAKQTNRYLRGKDAKGSWNDYVKYWMPFLDNANGAYGFHDASWRKNSDFGKIDPYSLNASHGCVELPSTVSQWLYTWSPIGTRVIIQA